MKFNIYILIIIFLLFIILISLFFNLKKNEEIKINFINELTEEEICLNLQGDWVRAGEEGYYLCVHHFSDGGEPCNSSLDCESLCLVKRDGTSYCKYDNNPFGCFLTIEDYREGLPGVCID